MSVSNANSFLQKLKSIWRDKPEYLAAEAFVEFLDGHAEEVRHVTYGYLADIARNKNVTDPVVIARVAQYFADTKILNLEFEFIDDEDNVFELDLKTVANARKTGKFLNPETGEFEKDFENKIFVFFSASSQAKKLFSRKG
jgi:hypothetical protein